MKKVLLAILLIGLGIFIFKDKAQRQFFKPNDNPTPGVGYDPQKSIKEAEGVEVVAQDLDIPWEVVFLPGGEILLTERPGNLVLIEKDNKKVPVRGVEHIGEGGLLGLAIHPNFKENQLMYLYLTGEEDGKLENRVERYKLQDDELVERVVMVDEIRASRNHDGGRIAFGPDSYLYIATGDAENSQSAQEISSLNGKILRVTDEGVVPSDNPFGNPVYSYGHRNVQGLAWDQNGNLWATEHGPSGAQTGNDELNKIEKGKNYGWPGSRGTVVEDGTVGPVIESGRNSTWAPSGMTIFNNNVYFAGLRGEAIYRYKPDTKDFSQHFKSEFGRLRTVTIGPDGNFYLLTNNTDGRGNPKDGDDKLLKVNPKVLE